MKNDNRVTQDEMLCGRFYLGEDTRDGEMLLVHIVEIADGNGGKMPKDGTYLQMSRMDSGQLWNTVGNSSIEMWWDVTDDFISTAQVVIGHHDA